MDNFYTDKELLNKILDYSDQGMFICDIEGNIVKTNNKIQEIFGCSEEEIKGKSFTVFIPEYNREKSISEYKKLFNQDKFKDIRETQILSKDGVNKYISFKTVLLSEFEQQQGILIFVNDITSEKEIENKLKLSHEKSLLILKNSNDVLNLLNASGEQFFICGAVEAITGYTIEEMEGNFAGKIHPEDLPGLQSAFVEVLMNKDKVIRFEYRHIHKTKEWVWLEAVGQNFLDNPAINAVVVNVRDISKHKFYEQELIKALEKAKEGERLKTEFLRNISHEVRTPLNGIVGFSDLLLNNPNSSKKYIFKEHLNKCTTELLNLIDNIMMYSRIQSQEMKLNIVNTDLENLVSKTITLFKNKVGGKDIEIRYFNRLELNQNNILTDKIKLEKILFCLLDNALKFTNKGLISLEIKLSEKKLGYIEFSISDTGIGIEEANKSSIFDAFMQCESGLSRKYGGNGLGLSIVNGLVKSIGGEINFESTKDIGSVFYFDIPVVINSISEHEITEKKFSKSFAGKTIMIVEDEASNYIYINELLENVNVEVIYAQNGKIAVDNFYKYQEIDLILMDIKMPIMDGITATRIIKKIRPEIPVIALTAFSSEQDKNSFFENGFDDFIPKPLNFDILYKVIENHIRR